MQNYQAVWAVHAVGLLLQFAMHFAFIAVAAVWVRPAHPRAWLWLLAVGVIGVVESLVLPTLNFASSYLAGGPLFGWYLAGTALLGMVGSVSRFACLVRGILLAVDSKAGAEAVPSNESGLW
jgi:hypothetical protein